MSAPFMPNDIIYESQIGVQAPAYLADYQQVQGITVLPIAAFLEMALAAAIEAFGSALYQLEGVEFRQLLFLPEATTRTIQIILSPEPSGDASFQIRGHPTGMEDDEPTQWILYASGRIRRAAAPHAVSERNHVLQTKHQTPGRGLQFSLSYFGSSEAAFTPDRYQLLIGGAKFADRHGYAAVWTPERHFHSFGGSYPAPAILSAALATITERVHLRAGSVVLPLHHPVRIAEEWSVVDNLSRGRVGLSFATGWSADDFVLAPDHYDNRKEILFSSIQLLKRFWRGEAVFLPNGSGKTAAVKLFPLPQQRELPTWLTIVKNPEMYVKAGEIGAHVLTNLLSQTTEELSRNIALYRDSLARNGYDPDAGQVTLLVHTFIGNDLDRVRQTVRQPFCDYLKSTVGIIQNLVKSLDLKFDLDTLTPKDMDDLLSYAFERYFQTSALLGTPAMAREMLARLTAIGVNEIACFIDFGVDYRSVMESLHLLNQVRETVAQEAVGLRLVINEQNLLSQAQARCPEKLSGAAHYRNLWESGIEYGPRFQAVEAIWKGAGEAVGRLRLPQRLEEEAEAYQIHPVLLDASLQVLTAILPVDENGVGHARRFLPMRLDAMRLWARPGTSVWVDARIRAATPPDDRSLRGEIRILDEDGRVLAEMAGLHLQRFDRALAASEQIPLEDLLYEVQWQQKAWLPDEQRAERFPRNEQGKWLIFADQSGLGQRVADLLTAQSETCICVSPGQNVVLSEQQYQINPERPEDFQQLVQQTLGASPLPWRGIVHLWSLDTTSPEETTLATLEAAQTLGGNSVMHLIQGLAEGGWAESPQLWLVTGGSQRVGTEPTPISIAQAPLWGLGRAVTLEHPELHCRTVDLENGNGLEQASALFEELWFHDDEEQVAIRGRERYVPRLVRCSPESSDPSQPCTSERAHRSSVMAQSFRLPAEQPGSRRSTEFDASSQQASGAAITGEEKSSRASALNAASPFRADSTYLITGGFGVLGLILSRHLVQQGVRHLALIGRSGPSPESREALEALRSAGAEICEIRGDVSQEQDVARALAQIQETMPPLRGIVHAAMWIEDAVLLQLNRERFAAAMKPKVDGAWNLHTQTLDRSLDFFVLFSSAVSLLGSAGQGNYVAANAFLDALAHYRRFLHLPALTIDWGQWAETHLQSRRGLKQRMALMGMRPIPPQQGLTALEWLLQQDAVQMMVLSVNWHQVFKSFPVGSRPALLSELVPAQAARPLQKDRAAEEAGEARARLLALPPEERQAWVQTYIRSAIATVLRLPPAQIDPQQPLNTLGLDSLMAIEMKNSIEANLRITLPLVRLLEGPSAEQLAAIVLAEIGPSLPSDQERLADLLQQVAQLSDEEAQAMLAREKLSTGAEG